MGRGFLHDFMTYDFYAGAKQVAAAVESLNMNVIIQEKGACPSGEALLRLPRGQCNAICGHRRSERIEIPFPASVSHIPAEKRRSDLYSLLDGPACSGACLGVKREKKALQEEENNVAAPSFVPQIIFSLPVGREVEMALLLFLPHWSEPPCLRDGMRCSVAVGISVSSSYSIDGEAA